MDKKRVVSGREVMAKILCIEDDVNVLETMLEIVGFDGSHQAIGAENGEAGLLLAQRFQPDLIFCDVMMPRMDGLAVLEALRKDPATASIPFIIVTSQCDEGNMITGMFTLRDVGDGCLRKPFDPREILSKIEEVLAGKSNRNM
jgi:CheY-like chemotaxis protein